MPLVVDVSSEFEVIPQLESDENAETNHVVKQRSSKNMMGFLGLVVTVISLVAIYVVCVVPSFSSAAMPTRTANLNSAIELSQVPDSPAMIDAKESFKAWATGQYAAAGGKCQHNGKSIIAPEYTLQTNAAIVNAGIAKVYRGLSGLCTWMKVLEQFNFTTFKGDGKTFYDLNDGRIITVCTWTPTLISGAKADHEVADATVTLWAGGKQAYFKYFFAEPGTLERLFVSSAHAQAAKKPTGGDFQAWLNIFSAWGSGEFHGSNCSNVVADLVHPRFHQVNTPYIRSTSVQPSYNGLDGYCAWIKDLERFDFSQMSASMFAVSEHEILFVSTYTPALMTGGKANRVLHDVAFITMQDGKLLEFKFFYSQPKVWDDLSQHKALG